MLLEKGENMPTKITLFKNTINKPDPKAVKPKRQKCDNGYLPGISNNSCPSVISRFFKLKGVLLFVTINQIVNSET